MSDRNLFYDRNIQFHQITDDNALGGVPALDRYLRVRKSYFVRELAGGDLSETDSDRCISIIAGINLSINFLARLRTTKRSGK